MSFIKQQKMPKKIPVIHPVNLETKLPTFKILLIVMACDFYNIKESIKYPIYTLLGLYFIYCLWMFLSEYYVKIDQFKTEK